MKLDDLKMVLESGGVVRVVGVEMERDVIEAAPERVDGIDWPTYVPSRRLRLTFELERVA